MADKAKFAFGSLANLDAALASGAVDAFDLLCLVDDDVARIGWVDKNGSPVIIDVPEDEVIAVDALPESGKTGVMYIVGKAVYIWDGNQFVAISESTDLSVFEERVAELETKASSLEELIVALQEKDVELEAKFATKIDSDEANAKYLSEMYEVVKAPDGTLVDYNDKEIRIMVPADTDWDAQENASSTGAENMFYIEIRAYAPEGATGFRDSDINIADDAPVYGFDYTYAGTDEFGRNYIVLYQPVAHYDSESGAWVYYGVNSTTTHYIGWTYQVEWYDVNSNMFAYDTVRINLSNEDCHFEVKPYYMGEFEAEIKTYTDEQIEAKIEEIAEIPVVEF